MSGTFSSLSIALSGLQTQKKSIDTTGHNISNANTEGYTRQKVVQTSSTYTAPGILTGTETGQTGTGVEVDKITRIKDDFINTQINQETQEEAYWEKILEGITKIESIFDESSDSSLNDALNDFYDSLQDLNSNPEDTATRKTVVERARVVADSFYAVSNNLLEYQSSLDDSLGAAVEEINSIISNIADLNEEIVSIKNSGQEPNDLLDKRDQLLKELNTYIDVQSSENDKGSLQVSLNGIILVSSTHAYNLRLEQSINNQSQVVYSQTGKEIIADGGSLAAVLELRDQRVNDYLKNINQMAESFVEEFNSVHHQGYDLNGDSGEDFFALTNEDNVAMGISITQEIEDDLNKIAAGKFSGTYSDNEDVATVNISIPSLLSDGYQIEVTELNTTTIEYTIRDDDGNILQDTSGNNLTGTAVEGDTIDLTEELGIQLNINGIGEAAISFAASVGNGENALDLSETIKENQFEELNDSSFVDYYESIISSMGIEGQEAEDRLNNQEDLLEKLEEQRENISGVSLDEEITNIIKYQQAYTAASKIITITDEMLETLMEMI